MAKRSDVTGTIELATSGPLAYGNFVSFSTNVTGRLSSKGRVYVQVIGSQNGKVVYQWSADPSFSFPLVQQDGLAAVGAAFAASQPAAFVASLTYREDGGQTIIKTLAQVEFATIAN